MTLATSVRLRQPLPVEPFFFHLLDTLASAPGFVPAWDKPLTETVHDRFRTKPDPDDLFHGKAAYEHERRGETVLQRHTRKPLWTVSTSNYCSVRGQGLCAILRVAYGDDGPLVHQDAEEIAEWGKEVPPTAPWFFEHAIDISFDTSYNYEQGTAGCSDLHAYLVEQTALYVVSVGGSVEPEDFAWHDECAGKWHPLVDLPRLGDARKVTHLTPPYLVGAP
jgi:hypothetical protein